MKRLVLLTIVISLCSAFALAPATASAQLLKRIKEEVKSRAENKVVREAGNATEKAMDKAKEGAVDAVKGKDGDHHEAATSAPAAESPDDNSKRAQADYRSYDFVPGDRIIFQPDLRNEPDAELPARFGIQRGNAEIQRFEGEKVLHIDAGGRAIVTPLMSTTNYLPEQFTVEFDMMYENDKDYFAFVNDFAIQFNVQGDGGDGGYGLYEFNIQSNEKVSLGAHRASAQLMPEALKKAVQTNGLWHHIAIYVRQNIAKAYINQYRVAASNTMPVGAANLAIRTDGNYGFKIKNFRLAAGGDDKYNKIITDGKFVTHGIQFDVAKATIKPESMGTLNDVAKLMAEHTDLHFEIQGHTDSDGSDDANRQLSQARAEAVKAKLVSLGVDEARLATKGLGETQPMDTNDTAEGKANNRRVEFVKQ